MRLLGSASPVMLVFSVDGRSGMIVITKPPSRALHRTAWCPLMASSPAARSSHHQRRRLAVPCAIDNARSACCDSATSLFTASSRTLRWPCSRRSRRRTFAPRSPRGAGNHRTAAQSVAAAPPSASAPSLSWSGAAIVCPNAGTRSGRRQNPARIASSGGPKEPLLGSSMGSS